jgi:hypothetical protein
MQEQQHQIKIYGFLQKAVYTVVALDCASLFYLNAKFERRCLSLFTKHPLTLHYSR